MANWRQDLYDKAPWAVKEWLVAAEAWRRNRYRRYGDYDAARRAYDLTQYTTLSAAQIRDTQLQKAQALIAHARANAPFYKDRLPAQVNSLADLQDIPILTKRDLRYRMAELVSQNYPENHIYKAYTSGSTGTPILLHIGREGIRARFALQDNYYALYGCDYGKRRVRMGGSRIQPASSTTPPFWILNRLDNQLQMSPYHLDERSFPAYRDKINAFQPEYFTGYGHALYNFAVYLLKFGGLDFRPRAIFLDSEGVPPHYVETIQQGFDAPVYEIYGLGEAGWVGVQTPGGHLHLLGLSCLVEIVDDNGDPLPPGELGRIVVTDFTQHAVPYIRYDTGDMGRIASDPPANPDWPTPILEGIEGRKDEIIVTPLGRRVGRLSHVSKPGRGIIESQIAHIAPDQVEIRVVPADDFDPDSMETVVSVATQLLGEEMTITWRLVDAIARTARHKFKHVVREFDEP